MQRNIQDRSCVTLRFSESTECHKLSSKLHSKHIIACFWSFPVSLNLFFYQKEGTMSWIWEQIALTKLCPSRLSWALQETSNIPAALQLSSLGFPNMYGSESEQVSIHQRERRSMELDVPRNSPRLSSRNGILTSFQRHSTQTQSQSFIPSLLTRVTLKLPEVCLCWLARKPVAWMDYSLNLSSSMPHSKLPLVESNNTQVSAVCQVASWHQIAEALFSIVLKRIILAPETLKRT